jgi:hypothetical protein
VPNISTNIPFIYQISQNGRKVEFTTNSVTIGDLEDNAFLAVDFVSKLWHEWFGHLNFYYLQQLNMQDMATSLPRISFSYGFCLGCALGKHPLDKGKAWRAS